MTCYEAFTSPFHQHFESASARDALVLSGSNTRNFIAALATVEKRMKAVGAVMQFEERYLHVLSEALTPHGGVEETLTNARLEEALEETTDYLRQKEKAGPEEFDYLVANMGIDESVRELFQNHWLAQEGLQSEAARYLMIGNLKTLDDLYGTEAKDIDAELELWRPANASNKGLNVIQQAKTHAHHLSQQFGYILSDVAEGGDPVWLGTLLSELPEYRPAIREPWQKILGCYQDTVDKHTETEPFLPDTFMRDYHAACKQALSHAERQTFNAAYTNEMLKYNSPLPIKGRD